ncbi:MAG: DUF4252 domain-containing protein [Tannerella sp.]|jgi:hypothetical protein|nr:DUF4252 domain-containing protein [Tannerella sp.]
MKKILLSLAAVLLFSFVTNAQTVDQLFRKYAKESGVVHVNIGKFGMMFAGLFSDTGGVKGVDVLAFSDCAPSLREELQQAVGSLKDPDYEPLVTVNDKGEHVRILVKTKSDRIRELVVLSASHTDMALVRIRGNIRLSDLSRIIND